jgi:enoyl-CoA hydratase/carnithine racemase
MAQLRVHVHGHTGTVILNRPEKRNALSRSLLAELVQALHDLHLERAVRAVVLAGAGSAFCAGMDLTEMLQTSRSPDAHVQWYNDAVAYRDLVEQMLRFPKPLIAAVQGPALAGGLGLVLACDYVLAAPEAVFGLPEPRRGIVAGMVAPLVLFRLGGSQAARLLVFASTIDAAEAQRIGLCHEILPGERLWARANELAADAARSAPEAVRLSKQLLNETLGEHLFTQLSAGAAASAAARTTEAAAEGLAAFVEKREPRWP